MSGDELDRLALPELDVVISIRSSADTLAVGPCDLVIGEGLTAEEALANLRSSAEAMARETAAKIWAANPQGSHGKTLHEAFLQYRSKRLRTTAYQVDTNLAAGPLGDGRQGWVGYATLVMDGNWPWHY